MLERLLTWLVPDDPDCRRGHDYHLIETVRKPGYDLCSKYETLRAYTETYECRRCGCRYSRWTRETLGFY